MKVENIISRPANTRFGVKPAYDVIVDGTKYGHGFKKPMFNIGDDITFSATSGKYGPEIDPATVSVAGVGGTLTSPAKTAPSPDKGPSWGSGGGKVFPIPPLHGDRAIVRQNSVTNATRVWASMFPGQPQAPGVAASWILELAREFEAYSCGDIELEAATKKVEND